MPECLELVVYEIKPESKPHFSRYQAKLRENLSKLEGFMDYQSYQSTDNPLCFSDHLSWQDEAVAKSAFSQFHSLESADEFMGCIDKVLFSGHFVRS